VRDGEESRPETLPEEQNENFLNPVFQKCHENSSKN
jgi:hypothetical protein